MSFESHTQNGLSWLTSPRLSIVCHVLSTPRGGVSPAPFASLDRLR